MDVDVFLKHFVEGYLFHDLASLARIRVDGPYGNCGYTMALVALAGTEFLGALTGPKLSGPQENFDHGWRHVLYPYDRARQELAAVVYQLARHGIAHAFIAKPLIVVSKDGGDNHLQKDTNGHLIIDAIALADDLRRGYSSMVLPLLSDASERARLQIRLDQIRSHNSEDSRRHETRIAGRPVALKPFVYIPSGGVMIGSNSPTYQSTFAQVPDPDDDD